MRNAAAGGFSTATDIADYLVQKGMPFRDAHAVTGQIVRYCIENNKTLDKLDLFVYQQFSTLFDEEILQRVRVSKSVEARKVIGGSARSAVRENIRSITKCSKNNFEESLNQKIFIRRNGNFRFCGFFIVHKPVRKSERSEKFYKM